MELQLISILTLAVHWVIVVGLALRIVMRRPPVGVSLAWLAVIFSVPFLGAFIYLLFGEKRLGRRRHAVAAVSQEPFERWLREQAVFGIPPDRLQPAYVPLARQAENVLGQRVMPGNSVVLLSDYAAFFARLLADIAAARRSIDLGFYIWQEGGLADEVGEALVAATRRGVRCRVLLDAVGAEAFLRGVQAARLRREGVILTAALPASLLSSLTVRADLRNHRKLVVIDHAVAYTGSQNLVDPRYFKTGAGVGEWVDAMVRLAGPTATMLSGVFGVDWAIENHTLFETPPLPAPPAASGCCIQVVPSGPDLHPGAMHQLFLAALYSAQHELVLTTPYFVPDEAIVTALISAAQRGVAVSLVVPLRNDSKLVKLASASQYDDLLCAGVRIFRYEAGLLHTKSLTMDGALSMFGSVNLDARSLWLNFEISLLLYDGDFTHELRALQQRYLDVSLPLELREWRRRPRWRYLAENCCRLIGPLL
jgi:cardiolipin synthase